MRSDVSDWLADGRYLLSEALWRPYSPLTRRLPFVVRTRKALAVAERNAFELGRDAGHYFPRLPEPLRRLGLSAV